MGGHNWRVCGCFECAKKRKTSVWGLVALGLASIFWLVVRTGRKPSRINYPCQRLAAVNSVAFLGWLAAVLGVSRLFKVTKSSGRKLFYFASMVLVLGMMVSIYRVSVKDAVPKAVRGQSVNPKVVWIHDTAATNNGVGYTYSSNNYDSRASLTGLEGMLDRGIMALSGQVSVAAAWNKIFTDHNGGTGYSAGEKICVKLNFNNTLDQNQINNSINPLPQTAMALIKQLTEGVGVSQADIWLFDATRSFPTAFNSVISGVYSGVQLNPSYGVWAYGEELAFGEKLTPLLNDDKCKYLINVPLLKTHSTVRASLSMKNNMGTIAGPGSFHDSPSYGLFNYSELVNLNNLQKIKNKTILIVGDAVYGVLLGDQEAAPTHQLNSIFLSTNTVSADSVMVDYIQKQAGSTDVNPYRVSLLSPAAISGLGNYESSCTVGTHDCTMTYASIDLVTCDPNCPATTPTDTPTPTNTPVPTNTPAPTATPTPVIVRVGLTDPIDVSALVGTGTLSLLGGTSPEDSQGVVVGGGGITFEYGSNKVVLSRNTQISSSSGGNWDTRDISLNVVEVSQIGGVGSDQSVIGVLQWGVPNLGLNFDQSIDVEIFVGEEYDGQTFNILRSISGNSGWTSDGLDNLTCVISQGKCTFSTRKASYFAVSRTIAASQVSVSSGSNNSSGPPGPEVCNKQMPVAIPKIFQIRRLNSTTLRLYFVPVPNPVDRFYISYGETPKDKYGVEFLQGISPGALYYDIGYLKKNVRYYFRIRAGNGCMPGEWSKWVSGPRYSWVRVVHIK